MSVFEWVFVVKTLGARAMYQAVYDAILMRAGVTGRHVASQPESPDVVDDVGFQQRLETHLVDVRAGRGWRSRGVNHALRERHASNGQTLARFDPEALRMYVGLISGMEYAHQARLAASVFTMSRDLDALRDAGALLAAPTSLTPTVEPPSDEDTVS